jgi:hypothetical protein
MVAGPISVPPEVLVYATPVISYNSNVTVPGSLPVVEYTIEMKAMLAVVGW